MDSSTISSSRSVAMDRPRSIVHVGQERGRRPCQTATADGSAVEGAGERSLGDRVVADRVQGVAGVGTVVERDGLTEGVDGKAVEVSVVAAGRAGTLVLGVAGAVLRLAGTGRHLA